MCIRDRCKDGEEDDKDNQHCKSGRTCNAGSSFFHFFVHLFAGQCAASELFSVNVGEDTFQDNDRAIYYNTKVNGAKTHQIGGDIEYTHHDKSEEHCQRDDGCYNQDVYKRQKYTLVPGRVPECNPALYLDFRVPAKAGYSAS